MRCKKVYFMDREFKTIKELWEYGIKEHGMTGVSYQRFRYRVNNMGKLTPEELFKSEHLNSNFIVFKGKVTTISQVAREHGFSKQLIFFRINKKGLTIEEALKIPVKGKTEQYTVSPEGYIKYAKSPKELEEVGLPKDWFSQSLDEIFEKALSNPTKYDPYESNVNDFRGGIKIG